MSKKSEKEIEEERLLNEPENQNPLSAEGLKHEQIPARPLFKSIELDLPESEEGVKAIPEFDWVKFYKETYNAEPDKSYSLAEWNEWYEVNKEAIDDDAIKAYAIKAEQNRHKINSNSSIQGKAYESDADKFNKLQNEKYAERNKLKADFEKSQAANQVLLKIDAEIKGAERALKAAKTQRDVSDASKLLKSLQDTKEFASKDAAYHSVTSKVHKIYEAQKTLANKDIKVGAEFSGKIAAAETAVLGATVNIYNLTTQLEAEQKEILSIQEHKTKLLNIRKEKAEAIKDIKAKLKVYEINYGFDKDSAQDLHQANKKLLEIVKNEKAEMNIVVTSLGGETLKQFNAKSGKHVAQFNNHFSADHDRGDEAQEILKSHDKPNLLLRLLRSGSKTAGESLTTQADILIKALETKEKAAKTAIKSDETRLKTANKSLSSMFSKLAEVQEKVEKYFLKRAQATKQSLDALETISAKSHGEVKGLAQLEHQVKSEELKSAMAKIEVPGQIKQSSRQVAKDIIDKMHNSKTADVSKSAPTALPGLNKGLGSGGVQR